MTPTRRDDLGHPVPVTRPRRLVSLVPSLTETVAEVAPERLVGATAWCTHPAGLDVRRVRGTKNPDLAAVRELAPDLVLANKEENRELDVRRLRESGIPVWVTDIQTVPAAVASLRRLITEVLERPEPAWLTRAARRWCGPIPEATRSAAVAVWRDPWMVVGSPTFTGDLVSRLGLRHVYDDHAGGRYPRVEPAQIDRDAEVVVLPDEPYAFTAADGPEAFSRARPVLVSGRLLTWYGPSLATAYEELHAVLFDA